MTAQSTKGRVPLFLTRYYTGRLLTYDEKFQEADAHLTYAFKNCDPRVHENKRRILRYLIPVSETPLVGPVHVMTQGRKGSGAF